jgi:hypothetical protein
MFYAFLLFLNLLFLGYEFIIFNEEFFIAFTFFSFFFAASSAIGSLLSSFYTEDKVRVFQYVADDIFLNFSFFQNYINYLTVYEHNKEFFYQYINFLGDGLVSKFFYFYEDMLLNNSLSINERMPEAFFNFSDKLLSFVSLKVQSKFLEYFNNKWDSLIINEVIVDVSNLEEDADQQSAQGWIFV